LYDTLLLVVMVFVMELLCMTGMKLVIGAFYLLFKVVWKNNYAASGILSFTM